MADEPFDWERSEDRWGRHGNGTPVTHYEFIAAIGPLERKMDQLHDKIRDVEERLVEQRMKHLAGDMFTSLWSRFLVIVLAVITAFVLTNFLHTGWPPW